jgi:hydroxypyruvate isomerase
VLLALAAAEITTLSLSARRGDVDLDGFGVSAISDRAHNCFIANLTYAAQQVVILCITLLIEPLKS